MIVIRLRAFTLAALAVFVVAVALILAGDLYGGGWYVIAHLGMVLSGLGTACLVIAWLERRLASVERAFQLGVDAAQANGHRPLSPLR